MSFLAVRLLPSIQPGPRPHPLKSYSWQAVCPEDGDRLPTCAGELDISAITTKYEQEERGYPPYNPRMMVALLFYAYCRGIFSPRKIMQACEERLTFKVIVGDDIPNLRTISDFRKLHLKELEQLFIQVLQLCQKAGLVKLGHIALDGTKVKDNASGHKAMSYGRIKQEEKRLKQEIHQLLSKAEAVDQQEDKEYSQSFV